MAMTIGVDIHAIYYRLDDLKEVGRDANHLPKTLEELTALAHQLERKNPDGSLKRVGFLPQNFEQLAPSFGQTFPDEYDLKMNCKSELDAATYIYGQDKRLGFENVTRFLSAQPADVGVDTPMLTGNYSMVLDGQWRVKQTATFAPHFNYTVGPIPPPAGGRENASYTNADLLLIPKGSKQSKGAWEFIKYWIGFDKPQVGAVNTADMAWLPYCPAVAKQPEYQAYLKQYPAFKAFLDMMSSPNLSIPPQGPIASYISDQLQSTDDGLNRGAFTPPRRSIHFKARSMPKWPASEGWAMARKTNPLETPLTSRVLVTLTLILLCLPALLPLLWMVSTSLKTNDEVFAKNGQGAQVASLLRLIPHTVRWQNYPDALHAVPYLGYLRNTVYLCVVSVIGAVFSSAVVAYGFAKHTFIWSGFLFLHDLHDGDSAPGHDDSDVRSVQIAGLVRHLPSAHRARVYRRALLHFSSNPVLPNGAGRALGSGPARWDK